MTAETTTPPAPQPQGPPGVPLTVTASGLEGLQLFEREITTYRRELPRLLDEGHAGRHALIKGEEVVGTWETREEAKRVALEKYLLQPVLIHPIRSREPLLRGPLRVRRWHG